MACAPAGYNSGRELRGVGDHLAIALPGGTALFTTRRGGVSDGPFASLNLGLWTDDDAARVRENRARVARLGGGRIAQARQVHGTRVVAADPDAVEEADGQVTAERGVAAMALTADCLPIALVAPEGVAMLHAGWRGLADGVIAAGVEALRGLGADEVAAAIGPGAGPCCYEVGEEVHAAFGTERAHRSTSRRSPASGSRRRASARPRRRAVHDLTTERFFSHRRDRGVTGRQAGVAWRS